MLTLLTFIVTPFQQNARLLWSAAANGCWAVDPGGEVERLYSAARERSWPVDRVLLTHAHIDHGGGVERFRALAAEEQGARPLLAACGEEERYMRSTLSQQAALFGLPPGEFQNVPEPDEVLRDGDELQFGELSARVLFTPGHSPGHLSFYFERTKFAVCWIDERGQELEREEGEQPLLIAGDALFAGSIGRTDLPGADHQTLLRSISEKIYTLPDDTKVLSGHGPDTTVGIERRTNPFIRG